MLRLRSVLCFSCAFALAFSAIPASAGSRLATAVSANVVTTSTGLPSATQATAAAEPTVTTEPTATPQVRPLPHVRLQDDDLRVGWSGSWGSVWTPGSSGQTHRTSLAANAASFASFEGTSVAVVSRKGPDRGRARIFVDGVAKATIDLYGGTLSSPKVIWRSATLSNSRHSIKVVALETKSSVSSGTRIVIDAYDVVGTPSARAITDNWVGNPDSRIARRGTWWTSTQPSAVGGTTLRSEQKGATITLRFKGTRFAWVGQKSALLGKAEVLIDGRKVATVSQYASSSASRRVAFARSGLPYGTHNVTIRVLDAPSTGSYTRVDFDGFTCDGTVYKAFPATPFRYPWVTYIVIDKSQFKLYWVKQGVLLKTYPIAHGKASTPTPSRVWRIDAKYHTDPASVYGPRKMRLYRRVKTSSGYVYEYTRYLIHGTNEPWVIGTRASHGCIRMYNRDVLELFPQVPMHTMVVTRD